MDRNWRCPEGEIDIVALDGDTLVIAELKTRRNLDYGHPFEAIGAAKLARLHRLALSWCRDHEVRAARRRVDVVGVIDDGSGEPQLEHLRGVG
ncbi:putative endonuclease [Arthrobacter bambusae]|nr:putative endonuclease [Arthrobacter bambusae]MDQ0100381.1 putative endonuclease [Arthrobacter bambusae]